MCVCVSRLTSPFGLAIGPTHIFGTDRTEVRPIRIYTHGYRDIRMHRYAYKYMRRGHWADFALWAGHRPNAPLLDGPDRGTTISA